MLKRKEFNHFSSHSYPLSNFRFFHQENMTGFIGREGQGEKMLSTFLHFWFRVALQIISDIKPSCFPSLGVKSRADASQRAASISHCDEGRTFKAPDNRGTSFGKELCQAYSTPWKGAAINTDRRSLHCKMKEKARSPIVWILTKKSPGATCV